MPGDARLASGAFVAPDPPPRSTCSCACWARGRPPRPAETRLAGASASRRSPGSTVLGRSKLLDLLQVDGAVAGELHAVDRPPANSMLAWPGPRRHRLPGRLVVAAVPSMRRFCALPVYTPSGYGWPLVSTPLMLSAVIPVGAGCRPGPDPADPRAGHAAAPLAGSADPHRSQQAQHRPNRQPAHPAHPQALQPHLLGLRPIQLPLPRLFTLRPVHPSLLSLRPVHFRLPKCSASGRPLACRICLASGRPALPAPTAQPQARPPLPAATARRPARPPELVGLWVVQLLLACLLPGGRAHTVVTWSGACSASRSSRSSWRPARLVQVVPLAGHRVRRPIHQRPLPPYPQPQPACAPSTPLRSCSSRSRWRSCSFRASASRPARPGPARDPGPHRRPRRRPRRGTDPPPRPARRAAVLLVGLTPILDVSGTRSPLVQVPLVAVPLGASSC